MCSSSRRESLGGISENRSPVGPLRKCYAVSPQLKFLPFDFQLLKYSESFAIHHAVNITFTDQSIVALPALLVYGEIPEDHRNTASIDDAYQISFPHRLRGKTEVFVRVTD